MFFRLKLLFPFPKINALTAKKGLNRVLELNRISTFKPINNRKPIYCNNLTIVLGIVPFVPKVLAQTEEQKNTASDVPNSSSKVINPNESEETGWDRLCAMFKLDEFGNASKEINAVYQATFMAGLFGLMYGGVSKSRDALNDFIERNQATIFENPRDAKRRLQNHVTIHFGKGAARYAWKLSVFTGGFMLFLTSMSVYRGHSSIIDYSLSGAVVGALLRFQTGPPAMAVGGLVGGVLGSFCGLMTQILLSVYGASLDEVMSFQYEMEQRRKKLFKEGEAKSLNPEIGKEVHYMLIEREKSDKEKEL